MAPEAVTVTVGETTSIDAVAEVAQSVAGAATVDAQEAQIAASVAEANASAAESAAEGATAAAVIAASLAEANAAEAMIAMGSRVGAIETRMEEIWQTTQSMAAQLSALTTAGMSSNQPASETEEVIVAVEEPGNVDAPPAVETRIRKRGLL